MLLTLGLLEWRTSLRSAAWDLGQRYACVGKLAWPTSYPPHAKLRLRLTDHDTGEGVGGLRVRACSRRNRCDAVMAETTQADGFATLSIDHDSYLTVEGRTNYPAQVILYSGTLLDRPNEVLRLTASSVLRSIQTSLSAPVVETHALVEAGVYDRAQRPAAGVRLEVWNAQGDGYRYCTECRIVYPGANGSPDATQTQFSANADGPAWMVLAQRDVMFIAREVATQRPISVLGPVSVRFGSIRLVLTPASVAQLASLPAGVRFGPPELRE